MNGVGVMTKTDGSLISPGLDTTGIVGVTRVNPPLLGVPSSDPGVGVASSGVWVAVGVSPGGRVVVAFVGDGISGTEVTPGAGGAGGSAGPGADGAASSGVQA